MFPTAWKMLSCRLRNIKGLMREERAEKDFITWVPINRRLARPEEAEKCCWEEAEASLL